MAEIDTYKIACDIYESLQIPEDAYKSFDKSSAHEYEKQYLYDDEYIGAMVDLELAKIDTSGISPINLDHYKDEIADYVYEMLSTQAENFYSNQAAITQQAYADIVRLLKEANIENVIDVENEYEPADPEVGIFSDHHSITITLSNGEYINFDVEFGD
jgi:hypothetical protein